VPELVIRPVDPYDDADMDAFQEVYASAERAEDPGAHLYSREDGISLLTSTEAGRFNEGIGAFQGDLMVGEAMLAGSRIDNLDNVRIWVWVAPDHARQGIGATLVAHAEQRARDLGRSVAHAQARIGADGTHGAGRFAERLGYTVANREVERRLPLPPDLDLVERLAAEAAPHHADYRIRTVVGPVPAELVESYAELKNLMNTQMPQGDLQVEAGRETAAEITAQDRQHTESGRVRVSAYALDHDGTVVGYAMGSVTGDGYDHVDQSGTLVHPAHRGHRLGMAVKCAQLRELADAFPAKRFVETTNAETNAPMVAINEALGFRVHQVWGDFQKRI
jgi:GNAT superfamily N-acetyltransferase